MPYMYTYPKIIDTIHTLLVFFLWYGAAKFTHILQGSYDCPAAIGANLKIYGYLNNVNPFNNTGRNMD